MVHLEVDPDLLGRTASNLRAAVAVARDVADRRQALAGLVTACGSARMRGAVEDFLGEWGYGMKLIVEDAERLAKMLEAGAATYTAVEDQITQGLR